MSKTPEMPPSLLTVKDVAHRLNTCERTVHRLIKSKQLPAMRHGRLVRILPIDLDRFIAANRSHG